MLHLLFCPSPVCTEGRHEVSDKELGLHRCNHCCTMMLGMPQVRIGPVLVSDAVKQQCDDSRD